MFQHAAMNRELNAAGDNAKKREAIEKKYNEKKKKWAIAQAIIEGAIEIAKIWKDNGTNVITLPLAIALTAVAVGRTAGQIALISSQKFDKGGFTSPGPWDKPQGVVHSEEFVANRYAVRNKAVRPFLDVINLAQRSGQIHSLNTDTILRSVEARRGGFAMGGFTPVDQPGSGPVPVETDPELKAILAANAQIMGVLNERLQYPISANVVYSDIDRKRKEMEAIVEKTTMS
jgi:hypothetical protein